LGSRRKRVGSLSEDAGEYGALTAAEQKDYQANLVKERNKYMHEAGAMPHKVAADSLLNEMHTCIATVLKNV
jgi:hypothetical protein